jgi:hypothetical protein
MASSKKCIPKINDVVLVEGKPTQCVVIIGHVGAQTVDGRTAAGPVILYYDVPWAKLCWFEGKVKHALRNR